MEGTVRSEFEFGGLLGDLVEFLTLHAPDVFVNLGGIGFVLLGGSDVAVNTEIGDTIVDGPLFLGKVLPGGGGLDNTGRKQRLSFSLGIDGDELLKHELVDVPGTVFGLSSSEVLVGGENILVHTEVGDRIISRDRSGLLQRIGDVLVLQSLLLVSDVLLGGNDILVDTKVGHSIVLRPFLLLGFGSLGSGDEVVGARQEGLSLLVELNKLGVPLAILGLGIGNVLLSGQDVSVKTKVRHEIVDGVVRLFVPALSIEDVFVNSLLVSEMLLRGFDVVVDAEVGHGVSLGPVLLLSLGLRSGGDEELLVGEKRLPLDL